MPDPTILTPHNRKILEIMISDCRAGARGLRLGSYSPSRTPDERDADRAKADAMDRTADDAARTIAQSNDAERAVLQSNVDLCNRRVLDAHRYGTITQQNEAEGCRRDAMDALVAFNLRTIRMVPVTHVRA
jgi:hypothetical protein